MSNFERDSGDPYLMPQMPEYDGEVEKIAEDSRRAAIGAVANLLSLQIEYDYDLNFTPVAERRSLDSMMRGEEDLVGPPALVASWIDAEDSDLAYSLAVYMDEDAPKDRMKAVFTTMHRTPGMDDARLRPPFEICIREDDSNEERSNLIDDMAELGVENLSRIYQMTNKLRPSVVNQPNNVDPEVLLRQSLKHPSIVAFSLAEISASLIELNPKQQNVYELRTELENSLRTKIRERRRKGGENKLSTTIELVHEGEKDVCLVKARARRKMLSTDYQISEILIVKYDGNEGDALNFYDSLQIDMEDDDPERELSSLESNGNRILDAIKNGSPTISSEDFAKAYGYYAFGLHKLFRPREDSGE